MKKIIKINFRKKYILPRSKLGKLTIYLCLAFWIFFAIFVGFVRFGQRGGMGFFDNLYLTIPILLAGFYGVTSFLTGVVSFFKQKEKSLIVFLCLLWGAFVLVFISGEILTPH